MVRRGLAWRGEDRTGSEATGRATPGPGGIPRPREEFPSGNMERFGAAWRGQAWNGAAVKGEESTGLAWKCEAGQG